MVFFLNVCPCLNCQPHQYELSVSFISHNNSFFYPSKVKSFQFCFQWKKGWKELDSPTENLLFNPPPIIVRTIFSIKNTILFFKISEEIIWTCFRGKNIFPSFLSLKKCPVKFDAVRKSVSLTLSDLNQVMSGSGLASRMHSMTRLSPSCLMVGFLGNLGGIPSGILGLLPMSMPSSKVRFMVAWPTPVEFLATA